MAVRLGLDGRMFPGGRIKKRTFGLLALMDKIAPTVSNFVPANNATGVAVDTNLVITFNKNVRKGVGNITIKEESDDSTVETINVASGLVVVSGSQVTITPLGAFSSETRYCIHITNGAIKNMSYNDYAGISDKTTWNFTTADVIAPTVVSFSPLDDAIDVAIDANLVITFDEDVQKGTGNITIKKTSDDSVVEVIDVTSEQVDVSGAVVTINPTDDFGSEIGYYVEITAGAIKDV